MRVFITGGSRGIGAGLVRAVLRAGHDCAFTYRQEEGKVKELVAEAFDLAPGRRCRAWQLEVGDSAQVEAVGEAAIEELGGIDVVVNNAAIIRLGMAATLADRDWQDVVDANLTGPFYVSRFFLNEFLANGRGRFIHISSVAAKGMNGQVSYCASKAGLEGLSVALAKEYGRKNITSNVLRLGFFDTDMTQRNMSTESTALWDRFNPTGRKGRLSEISAAALFLMSDEASFVNGQEINLTGGMDWVT